MMKTLLYLIFGTPKVVEIIRDEYEETLYRRSVLLFVMYGVLTFLSTIGIEEESNFLMGFLELILSIAFSFFFGLMISFLLFRLGKLFGGEATFTETCVLYTYALVPQMLLVLGLWFLKNTEFWSVTSVSNNIIVLVFATISFKILLTGLVKLNKYGWLRGVVILLIFSGIIAGVIKVLLYTI